MAETVTIIDRCQRCGAFVPYHRRYSVRFKQVIARRSRAFMLCHECFEAVMQSAIEEIGGKDDRVHDGHAIEGEGLPAQG